MSNMKVVVWVATCEHPVDAGLDVDVSVFATYDEALAHVSDAAERQYRDAVGGELPDGDFEDWYREAVDQDIFLPHWSITHHDLDAVAVMATLSKEAEAA